MDLESICASFPNAAPAVRALARFDPQEFNRIWSVYLTDDRFVGFNGSLFSAVKVFARRP